MIVDEIRARGAAVLAVCGNTDQPEIEDYLRAEEIDLDRRARRGRSHLRRRIGGSPFGATPYERTEAQFADAAEEALRASAAPTILVSHQPPRDTRCDRARGGHVGSTAIREAVLRHRPDLVLCGHIHESAGSDLLGASRIINPGPWFQGGILRFTVVDGRIELE